MKPTMKYVIDKTCCSQEEKDLFKSVMNQTAATWPEIWEYPEDYRDASAGVNGFIYYTETEKFAEKNIRNILYCLNQFEEEIGEPLKKDNDNLLNWYAWFALEHVIDKIMMYKEQDNED